MRPTMSFSQPYHVVKFTIFKLSTWQFYRLLAAEKIAGKMIQDDQGNRGQPMKVPNATFSYSTVIS